MTMSTLMCPHCGGRLLIDPTQRLQSMLSCPYCGRKSLMQKKNGMIVLRGIISQSLNAKTPSEEASDVTQSLDEQPIEEAQPITAEITPPVPQVEETNPEIDDERLDGTAAEAINEMDYGDFSPAVKTIVAAGSLANAANYHDVAVEAVTSPLPPIEPAMTYLAAPIEPSHEEAVSDTALYSKPTDLEPASKPVVEITVEPAGIQETVVESVVEPVVEAVVEPVVELVVEAAVEPVVESSVEPTVEPAVEPVTMKEPVTAKEPVVEANPEPASPVKPVVIAPPKSSKEQLILLATRAAAANQIPAFNSYSRQAIDCDPTDPRMYELRSRLIEEAHGFARATFLSPVWIEQTPRQKAWIIAQHFASLNAAVAYSTDEKRCSLAAEAGALIAWQIRETFVESARLRLGKRPFKGRFRRSDLRPARQIIDACRCINETVVPHVSSDLLRSLRAELSRIDPRLASRLERIGF